MLARLGMGAAMGGDRTGFSGWWIGLADCYGLLPDHTLRNRAFTRP